MEHTCDIYHLKKTAESPGYALREAPHFSYGENPDLRGVKCHFCSKYRYRDTLITQREPTNEYDGRIKLVLPINTDIRLNDKVVDTSQGLEYTAQIPKVIRGHHISVFIKRTEAQEAL